MIDNSTDKLVPQAAPAAPVATDTTPSPVPTPPLAVITPAVDAPDTTARIATSNAMPSAQEVPQRDTVVDPRVIALRAMFPDYDDIILISVLDSAGGNQDRAIDALLIMGDPEYKGEPIVAVQSEQPPLTQTELDEQFARHLMIEEQQQRQQQWVNTNRRTPVAYESHPSQRRWDSHVHPDESDAVAENSTGDFHEQFNKIAESGKKTFGNLFNKVKAKIQEFDQGRSTGQTSTQPTNTSTYDAEGQARPATVTQPSYFDPNSHSSLSTPLVAHQSSPAAAPVLKGYNLSPSRSLTPPDTPEPLPAMNSTVPRSSIEAGKLGLLPKRPVSLLRDPAATSSSSPPAASFPPRPTRQLSEDDDNILEYTENPFDEETVKK